MRRAESFSLPLFPLDAPPAPEPERAPLALVEAPSWAPPSRPPLPASEHRAELEQLVARVNEYAANVRADATRRGYEANFRAFEAWCAERALGALPTSPATLAAYLAALAGEGRRPSTIRRALAGIACIHRERGFRSLASEPLVSSVMRGICRRHGVAPVQKAALDDGDLAAMMEVLGDALVDRRDRALLTVGWLGGFRRSELVALEVGDLTRSAEGLIARVRRAKGDQEGRGGGEGRGHDPALRRSRVPLPGAGARGVARRRGDRRRADLPGGRPRGARALVRAERP